MVFEPGAQFQQLIHCKFRENAVRLLVIPGLEGGGEQELFLIVNKYGKVGLYEQKSLRLVHTYLLELTLPMLPRMSHQMRLMAKYEKESPLPKCQRTHLIVDAVYVPQILSLIYLTTNGILQCYDIGEIERQSYGLELFPRKRFMGLKNHVSPCELQNKGHVETHRIFGLSAFPTCIEYYAGNRSQNPMSNQDGGAGAEAMGRLFIGNSQGFITVISIMEPNKPFGFRKIRNVLHEIDIQDLGSSDCVRVYKAHNEPVHELKFITQRQLVISCSRDQKFSLFVKDFTETSDPYIISLPRGVNAFAHSDSLRVIATGSDDLLLRLFNQFVIKMPQMELSGHRAPIVSIEFLQVPFSQNPILLSLSNDVELRAWDPLKYTCLQSTYLSFPIKSTIRCTTPSFARHPIFVHQPHYKHSAKQRSQDESSSSSSSEESTASQKKPLKKQRSKSGSVPREFERGEDGVLLILYCNSLAKLWIEKDTSHWPFDFEDLASQFEEMNRKVERKLVEKQGSVSKDPKRLSLTKEELEKLESELDMHVKEVMEVKRNVDRKLGRAEAAAAMAPSLSAQTTRRLYDLKAHVPAEAMSKAELVRQGLAFQALPLVQFEPIQFHMSRLPVTEAMREVGIDRIQGVEDLLSDKARKCFSEQNIRKKTEEAQLLEKAFELAEEQKHLDMFGYSRHNLSTDSSAAQETDLADEDEYLKHSLDRLRQLSAEDILVHDLALDDELDD